MKTEVLGIYLINHGKAHFATRVVRQYANSHLALHKNLFSSKTTA